MTALTINLVLQKTKTDSPNHVRKLNACGVQLDDISVLHNFPNLSVCSLSVNAINDLEVFGTCDKVEELYLRKNRISDFEQILALQSNPIRTMMMSDNPIAVHPKYRTFIIACLPSLSVLDDVAVTPQERAEARREFPEPHNKIPVMSDEMLAAVPPSSGPSGTFTPEPTTPVTPASNLNPAAQRAKAQAEANRQARAQQQQSSAFGGSSFDDEGPTNNGYNGDDVPVGMRGPAVVASRKAPTMRPKLQQPQSSPLGSPGRSDDYTVPSSSSSGLALKPKRQFSNNAASVQQRASSSGPSSPSKMLRRSPPNDGGLNYAPAAAAPSGNVREDTVVNAITQLMNDLSPAGLMAVQKHLDKLGGRF